jgi:hypothetical protein
MKTLTTLAIAIMLALSFSFAFAADSPKVSLNAQDMTLDQTAAELSKQAGIPVICDSAVRGTVSGSFSDIELDKLLDIITKPQNLKWQKVYLPDQKDKKLTFEQIKAQAEAVAAIADMPMAVYDPTTGKQTVFIKQAADAPAVSPEKLGLKPVYLITKPKAVEVAKKEENNSDDPVSAFQQLNNDRMKALMQMTPDQRVAALQQEMSSMMSMDDASRMQYMKDQFDARRNMDPALRDQMRETMRNTFKMMHDSGMIPEGWGHRGGDHGGNRGGDHPQN